MKWNVSVLRRSGECERTEVADFELSEFFNRIASAEGKAWVLSVERVGDVGDSALVEPDGDELVSQLGKRRWRVMGDPEDGWWVEVDSDGNELPGDWEYDRKGGSSTARSPSRAVRLLSAAAAPQKEDSRASAHRPRPLFELQDLGSVRTNSTVVDFFLTSILLPNGFSGLDGRALALWKTGNLELPVFSGRQPCRSISHRLQTRRRYLQTDDSGKTRGAESDMRRKEARVEVRMTEHEKEALKRKAAKNGMTVSEYARTLLANSDDATIRVIDTEPLRKAAHELAKQGTNLNQFMRFLNTYGSNALDHEEAKAVLGKEVAAFSEIMEALAALRREADRNNVHLKIEDFDNAEND